METVDNIAQESKFAAHLQHQNNSSAPKQLNLFEKPEEKSD